MPIPDTLLAAFPASATLLLELVQHEVDDGMLRDIARADYGCGADEAFAGLLPIRDTGILAANFYPSEVLELIRWHDPEGPRQPPYKPGLTGRRGQLTRLFACAVLLRASALPESRYEDIGNDSTIAICVSTAGILGDELSEAAARFLTWRLSQSVPRSDRVFVALALLVLAVRLRTGRFAEPALGQIADWVFASDEELNRERPQWNPLVPPPFSLQQGFWDPLKQELETQAAMIAERGVREKLQLCALLFTT